MTTKLRFEFAARPAALAVRCPACGRGSRNISRPPDPQIHAAGRRRSQDIERQCASCDPYYYCEHCNAWLQTALLN